MKKEQTNKGKARGKAREGKGNIRERQEEGQEENTMESIVANDKALDFMLAGKSEFTLLSLKTGAHFSYKVIKKESIYGGWIYFVNVIGQSEVYAGTISYDKVKNEFNFYRGRKGNYSMEDIEIKSLIYVLNSFKRGKYNLSLEVYHCGRCGRCGRRLTTPESIKTGLGPECASLVRNLRDSI